MRMPYRALGMISALSAAVLVTTSSPASAAVVLTDQAVRSATTAEQYPFDLTRPSWSAVALYGAAGSDYDLKLRDSGGIEVARSQRLGGFTDFAVINGNTGRAPLGRYTMDTVLYSGSGRHWADLDTGKFEISLPAITHRGSTGPSDPDLAFMSVNTQDLISVRDIQLSGNEKFWVNRANAQNRLFLVESDPASPVTFAQGRSVAAALQKTEQIDGCTVYTVRKTGRHALVMIREAEPAPDASVNEGLVIRRYSEAEPKVCPVKNFPAPTKVP
jgi:hypothetical protein